MEQTLTTTVVKRSFIDKISSIKIGSLIKLVKDICGGNKWFRALYSVSATIAISWHIPFWIVPHFILGNFLLVLAFSICLGSIVRFIMISHEISIRQILLLFNVMVLSLGVMVGLVLLQHDIGEARLNGSIEKYTAEQLSSKFFDINLEGVKQSQSATISIESNHAIFVAKGNKRKVPLIFENNQLCIQGIQCWNINPDNGNLFEPDGTKLGKVTNIREMPKTLSQDLNDRQKDLSALGFSVDE
jgi:hypothetical protein